MNTFVGLVDEKNISDDYDRYIWADSCCFEGIKWCDDNNVPYEILSNTSLSHKEVYERYLYFESVRKNLVEYAAKILNEYHDTNYGCDKWELLITSALINLIPSIYDKYEKLMKVLSLGGNINVHIYRTKEYVVPLDYYDLMFLLYEDGGFHRLLYSLMMPIIDKEEKIHAVISEYRRNAFRPYQGELPQHVREFIEKYQSNKEKLGIKDDVVIQSQLIKFELYKQIIETGKGRISGYFYNYYKKIRNDLSWDVDCSWRNTGRNDVPPTDDSFIKLMYRLLPQILPIAYVEEFKKIKEVAEQNYKWGKNPKAIIYDATEIHSDEMFKIYLMGTDHDISKRIGIQHAAFYGFGGDIWAKKFEVGQYDEFFGTGCLSDVFEEKKIRQMPLVTLFRMPKIDRIRNSKKVLFLNSSWPKNCATLVTEQCDYYIKQDISFLSKLEEAILDNVVIRYYPFSGFGYDIEESFKCKFNSIQFDSNSELYNSLRDTYLLISSGIGTSVIEAMRIGIPSIVMQNPQQSDHILSKGSEDLRIIDEMISVDLLAKSPERLARIVNDVYDDVEAWWKEPKRQKVASKILNKIAYFPDNASEMWIDAIANIC